LQNSGGHLGVRIGMSQVEADQRLMRLGLRHLVTTARSPVSQCGGRPIRDGELLDAWKDQSWRNGFVCLFHHDGHVAGIAWYFGPADPPEF
jgi:hypothetical protein